MTGNQAELARALGISRAAVSRQIKNSDRLGTPKPNEAGLYDVDAYVKWYREDFKPKSGPTRGIRADQES